MLEGDTGFVYEGLLEFDHLKRNIAEMPDLPFATMMMFAGNRIEPFAFAGLPNAGIGLARLEFIINRMISRPPQALLSSIVCLRICKIQSRNESAVMRIL